MHKSDVEDSAVKDEVGSRMWGLLGERPCPAPDLNNNIWPFITPRSTLREWRCYHDWLTVISELKTVEKSRVLFAASRSRDYIRQPASKLK